MFEPIDYDNIFVSEVAPDILHTPLLSKDFCSMIVEYLEGFDEWTTNRADRQYATHDCHLKDNAEGFYSIINDCLEEKIFPLAAQWWDINPFEVSQMFAVKYSKDTQTALKYHHDESYISATIKLNDDYEGGVLNFPHKKYDISEVPVGHLIMWPSQITHLHGCSELTKGTKYSITIWTQQCLE